MAIIEETLDDTMGAGGESFTITATYNLDAASPLTFYDSATEPTLAIASVAADTLGMSLIDAVALGLFERERVGLESVTGPLTTYNQTASDVLGLRDRLVAGYALALSETTGLSDAMVVRLAHQLTEALQLGDATAPAALYRLTYTEQVQIADLLVRTLGDAIADTMGVGETLSAVSRITSALTDAVLASDSPDGSLLVQVITSDDVEIAAEQAVQMLYSDLIGETISVQAIYLSPGSNTTTWALNTRTTALTQYTNYAFNSFADIAGRQIGATEDGLYELTGDDDAGEDIISALKTGMIQMGGSRFTSFKAAYLGVRGGGEFVLKLEMGDGRVHHYGVVARDMETTKIRLGRGLRARYFSFELISTGQDFDLDTLEFVPVVMQRRV